MIIKNQFRGIIYTLSGGVMWGFSGTCGKFLFNEGMTSSYLTPLRMFVSGLILLLIALTSQRNKLKKLVCHRRHFITALLFGVLGIIISQYCYLTAISYSDAGTATVLQYLGPAMIMAYVCIIRRRLPSLIEFICIVFAISGTFILATHGSFDSLSIRHEALFWGLLSAIGLTFYSLIPEKIVTIYGAIAVTGVGMTFGGILLMIIMQPWKIDFSWSMASVTAFFAIVLIGTVLAYTLYLKGVGLIGASKASLISCVEPVSAAFFSAFWLQKRFAPLDIIGFALIISTVILLAIPRKTQK